MSRHNIIGKIFSSADDYYNSKILDYKKSKLSFCGNDVILKKGIILSSPEKISIGNSTHIGEYSYLRGGGGITIGEYCQLASFTNLSTANHVIDGSLYYNNVSYKPINIGNNVWIGTGAIILAGISIGDNAVIGADAVVTKNVSNNTIVAGVPATKIVVVPAKD